MPTAGCAKTVGVGRPAWTAIRRCQAGDGGGPFDPRRLFKAQSDERLDVVQLPVGVDAAANASQAVSKQEDLVLMEQMYFVPCSPSDVVQKTNIGS